MTTVLCVGSLFKGACLFVCGGGTLPPSQLLRALSRLLQGKAVYFFAPFCRLFTINQRGILGVYSPEGAEARLTTSMSD